MYTRGGVLATELTHAFSGVARLEIGEETLSNTEMVDVANGAALQAHEGGGVHVGLPTTKTDQAGSTALSPELPVDLSTFSSLQTATTPSDMSRVHSGYSEPGGSHLELLTHQHQADSRFHTPSSSSNHHPQGTGPDERAMDSLSLIHISEPTRPY